MWLVWLALALVLGPAEVASGDFVLLMVAGGALVAAGSAGFDLPILFQAIVFAVSSAVLLFVVRPPLKRMMMMRQPHTLTGIAALSGREAQALTEINDHAGTVKLAGEVWTARTAERGATVEPGATVRVESIDGATAVVRAVGEGARELHREPPAAE
jgi:membrane protein implicated in regulation of membrane protease activity